MERDPESPPESCGIDTLGRQLSLALLLTRAAALAGWVRAVPHDRRCAGSAVTGCLVSMCAGSERQPESALVIGGTLWIVAPAATSPGRAPVVAPRREASPPTGAPCCWSGTLTCEWKTPRR